MAEIAEMGIRFMDTIPLDNSLWIPSINIVRSKFAYYLLTLLLHLLPAIIIDTALKLAGKKPM